MKQIIKNYSFNAAAKTITLTDFTGLVLERLAMVTDTTTNAILYSFIDPSFSTASITGNVITLSSVGSAASSDKLRIDYDVVSGDPTYDGYRELAGLTAGALNADLVPSTDVSGYKWMSLQLTGTFTATVIVQGSNDNTNFTNLIAYNTVTATTNGTQSLTSTSIYVLPITTRYIRARVTSYTSGTVTGTAELYTTTASLAGMSVVATQSGTWSVGSNSATGSAVPANAFYSAMRTFAGNLTGLATAGASGDAGSTDTSLSTVPSIFNGTTIDRQRSATSAAGTTGTGVPAAGMLIFDGTNYVRPTTASSKADTESGGSVPISAGMVFNGTNWDRTRGNTTGTFTVPRPTTSGGVTIAKIASAATTNATSVKASAGQVYGWSLFNTSAVTQYLKVYNKASAPTVGTDTPAFIVPLPAGGGSNIMLGDLGTPLATGIAYSITTGVADTDATATAANAVVGSVFYS